MPFAPALAVFVEQFAARRRVRDLPGIIAGMSERLSKLSSDLATTKARGNDEIGIRGRAYPREDIPAVLGATLDGLPKRVPEVTRIPLGTYRGLRFGLVLRPQFPTEVYLEGRALREDTLSRENAGPRAVLNALERLAEGYAFACDGIRQNLAIAEGQLRDCQARLGKAFTHEGYLTELMSLRDQLKGGLSGTAKPEGRDAGLDISGLAGRIQVLKAAHTVEPTPERVRQKHIDAEEPITARIRRLAAKLLDCNRATKPDAAGHTGVTHDCSTKPEVSFEERVDRRRRKKEAGTAVQDAVGRSDGTPVQV